MDRKLRLTAALLGTTSRKDLAAAFRRVNPNTAFDVARADKWLHGRARPRDLQIYQDWSKVLDLDRPGQWIRDCGFEDFLAVTCARHGREPEDVRREIDASGRRPVQEGPGLSLAGAYVSYSHAWSPYFRGQLIRGELTISAGRSGRPSASYAEILPTGRMQLDGAVAVDKRALRVEVSDTTRISQYVCFSLFPPTPPVSVLGGLMFGTTLIGPDAQPSVTRAVLIHLPAVSTHLRSAEAYLPPGASLAEDLEALGLPIDQPAAIDRCLAEFLNEGGRDGMDQVPASSYRALVDLFDRTWLTRARAGVPAVPQAQDGSTVRRFPGRFARARR
jgi:hypothetical protein